MESHPPPTPHVQELLKDQESRVSELDQANAALKERLTHLESETAALKVQLDKCHEEAELRQKYIQEVCMIVRGVV